VLPLRANALRRRQGGVAALAGVDLDVPAGSLLCVVGPSGAGKSTLLRVLAGLVAPDTGTVQIGGKDVGGQPPAARRAALVTQSPVIFPHLGVLENVAQGAEEDGADEAAARERALAALRAVGAEALAPRRGSELSGGMQQRVAVARALASKPSLLLLDEPFSHLDIPSRAEARDGLRAALRSAGVTAILVTHDLREAYALADQLAVMREGRVVQAGAPRDVYRRPADSWVAAFLGAANLLPGTVVRAAAGEAVVRCALGEVSGALAQPATPPAEGASVVVCIRPEGLHLDTVAPEENAFAGSVVGSTFLGDTALHDFQPRNGPPLKVLELNPRNRAGSSATCHAWVEPEDVVILPS